MQLQYFKTTTSFSNTFSVQKDSKRITLDLERKQSIIYIVSKIDKLDMAMFIKL